MNFAKRYASQSAEAKAITTIRAIAIAATDIATQSYNVKKNKIEWHAKESNDIPSHSKITCYSLFNRTECHIRRERVPKEIVYVIRRKQR